MLKVLKVPEVLKSEPKVVKETKAVYLTTFIFFILTSIKLVFHEMWGDETQPWLMARDSATIGELLINKQYESHPNLWYFLLYGLTRFSHNVYLMQALHVLLATGAVFIFMRYATFSLLTRILFCFGYFMFYEYSVMSRLYALGLLFVFGACALYPQRYRYWLPYCILLCLAANSNLFAAMISGGLVLITVYEYFFQKDEVQQNFSKTKFLVGTAILFFGFSYAMISMIKHPNHSYQLNPVIHIYYVNEKMSYFFNGFFPLTPFKNYSWYKNSFLLSYTFRAIVSIPVLLFIYFCLRHNKHIFYVYCIVLLAMLLFYYFIYNSGSIRHHGHMFMLFIVAAWINNYSYDNSSGVRKNKLLRQYQIYWVLNLILLVHVAGALQASGKDLIYKFSGYEDVASFLDKNIDKNSLVVGTNELRTSALTAYSEKFEKIFYYNTRRFGSYIIPDNSPEKKQFTGDSLNLIMDYCQALSQKQKRDVVVISSEKNVSEKTKRKVKDAGVEELYISTDLIFDYPLTVYKITYNE